MTPLYDLLDMWTTKSFQEYNDTLVQTSFISYLIATGEWQGCWVGNVHSILLTGPVLLYKFAFTSQFLYNTVSVSNTILEVLRATPGPW